MNILIAEETKTQFQSQVALYLHYNTNKGYTYSLTKNLY